MKNSPSTIVYTDNIMDFIEEASSSRYTTIKVLIVDANEDDFLRLKTFLLQSKKSHYSFITATTAEAGIELYQQQKFDIC